MTATARQPRSRGRGRDHAERRFAGLLLVLLGLWASQPAFSLSPPFDESGSIDIVNAQLLYTPGNWLLDATAEIQLSPEIRAGLDSGVPLQFIVDLSIHRPRPWWPDRRLVSFQQRYSLIYYELTRHYRVQALGTDVSHNFRSLLAALDELGSLRGVAVPTELDSTASLVGRLHIRLDNRALPLPLQPILSRAWRLSSEEYVWPLN